MYSSQHIYSHCLIEEVKWPTEKSTCPESYSCYSGTRAETQEAWPKGYRLCGKMHIYLAFKTSISLCQNKSILGDMRVMESNYTVFKWITDHGNFPIYVWFLDELLYSETENLSSLKVLFLSFSQTFAFYFPLFCKQAKLIICWSKNLSP